MSIWQWIAAMLGRHPEPPVDPVKVKLDKRQLGIAERLGRMKGVDRDAVLREAYRDAGHSFAGKR